MGKIQKLDQSIINKIAAGEVVERPASVVKELIENSIDAQAKKISVILERAGTQKIQIVDDGIGMDEEDALNSFQQHATSKINSEEDLYSIKTMGFRGEALSSIASVSKVTMVTRSKHSETGLKIYIEGGELKQKDLAASPQGTNISIEELFFNTPARKKFLKAESTELNHITEIFLNIACAHCDIFLELIHNSKTLYSLPAVNNLLERLHSIYGKEISDNLIAVNFNSPEMKIEGYICHPSIARTRRAQQKIFINSRPIQDYLIVKAVSEGYESTIPRDRFPIFFLFIDINPSLVDVNVHPRKLEVRFVNPQQVFISVKNAVSTAVHNYLQQNQQQRFNQASAVSEISSGENTIPNVFNNNNSPKAYKSYTGNPSNYKVQQSLDFTKELLREKPSMQEQIYTSTNDFTVLGQIFNTYIIVSSNDKLLVIDQHAAAERVTFEKLKQQYKNQKFETQKLLISETVEIPHEEFEILEDKVHILKKFGIELEVFGKDTFKVVATPLNLATLNLIALLEEIVENVKEFDIVDDPETVTKAVDHMLATLACHTSIRAGMKLEQPQMVQLINDLLKCENPYSCPHGRSVVWEITRNDIEKKVMRHE